MAKWYAAPPKIGSTHQARASAHDLFGEGVQPADDLVALLVGEVEASRLQGVEQVPDEALVVLKTDLEMAMRVRDGPPRVLERAAERGGKQLDLHPAQLGDLGV